MKRLIFLKRIVSSPLLTLFLIPLTVACGIAWYRADAALKAPILSGYDWAKHPDNLLIAFPTDDCGCGASPFQRVQEGLSRGLDVVVIASKPHPKLLSLNEERFPPSRFTLLTNVSENIITRFCPGDELVNVRVQNGRLSIQPQNEVSLPTLK